MSIAEKLVTIAENQQMVYDAGYAKGQAEGGDTDVAYNEGYADGINAAYPDTLWEAYQEGGNRTDYKSAFSGEQWTDAIYKPKYVPRPTAAESMYRYSLISEVNVDFSGVSTTTYSFADCPNLQKITIVMGENTNFTARTAQNSTNITEIMVSGVIKKSFVVMYFDLTRDSLLTIIDALYDLVGNGITTKGTLNLGDNKYKLTDEEIAVATEKGWTVY